MDTISSRENNSYLPVAGVIIGIVAIILSAVALVKVSGANKTLAAQQSAISQIGDLQQQVSNASAAASKASTDISALTRSTQDAFNQVAGSLGTMQAAITKLETVPAHVARARGEKAGAGAEAGTVDASGAYTIKSGDTLAKVARSLGVSLSALESANPGVDSRHLHVGQKIKVPQK